MVVKLTSATREAGVWSTFISLRLNSQTTTGGMNMVVKLTSATREASVWEYNSQTTFEFKYFY